MIAKLKREDGVSLPELLVSVSIGIIVLLGVVTIVNAASHSSSRTTARVRADQIARPALTRIIDELHSSCISPDLAPIKGGSTNDSVTFIYSTDRGVTPVPSKRTITYDDTAGTIKETVYPYVSGSAPSWVFSNTGTTTQIVAGVTDTSVGVTTPVFRYYAYDSTTGAVSTTPLNSGSTALTDAQAATVVQVDVSFAIQPAKNTVANDPNATVRLSDSVLFRFSPVTSTTAGSLLPCG